MGDWVAFWDSDHCIYVNARHRDVHASALAADISRYIPSPSATVLDYGCGEALHAGRLRAALGHLILVEAAPSLRTRLAQRFAADPKIEVRSPEDLAGLPGGSIDLAVINSVAQYLTARQLDDLLASFRRLLRPTGLLVIGDVLPPDVSGLTDVMALLRFAAAHGFLRAAIRGVVRTILSDYRHLRSRLGLSRYTDADIAKKLAAAGFSAERATVNIGHNQARMTFLARPR